jgi:hypothetical protein
MQECESDTYLTAADILSHPRFPEARLAYVDAVLALYEGNPQLIELMRDAGRIMTYGIILCLWGAYAEEHRATWPTINRLKAELAAFDVISARQVDEVLGRLLSVGFVTLVAPLSDLRARLVLPTDKLIEHDLRWTRAHYMPLGVLYGEEAYALPLAMDRPFQRAQKTAALPLLPYIADNVMRQNKPVMRILQRAVGMLALMKLVQMMARRCLNEASYSAVGNSFGVSRTHVRDVLTHAQEHGDILLEGRGRFRLMPTLLRSFDRIVADGMSVNDRTHRTALRSLGHRLDGLPAGTGDVPAGRFGLSSEP